MYTGTRARDWNETATHAAAIVQRVEAGLPWEQDPEGGHADQDGWLLSFIDVLTLLLTLFVLLLAYQHGAGGRDDGADVQASAVSQPETVLRAELPAMPPEPVTTLVPPVVTEAGVVEASIEIRPMADFTVADTGLVDITVPSDYLTLPDLWNGDWIEPLVAQVAQVATDTMESSDDPVEQLLADLNEPALQGRVEVTRQPGGVNLEISDSILFTPASAALTDGGRALLDELAAILKSLPYALSVEGHTDDRPIATDRFPSNWELASARANRVTRHLIGQGIAPERVRAIGYADTRPRADNLSPENRARNRRVSFVLRLPVS